MLETRDAYFWATHAGAELDLMVLAGGKRFGFEFKLADAPAITKSMRVAMTDLRLEHLWVIYPGHVSYVLDSAITVAPLSSLEQIAAELRAL